MSPAEMLADRAAWLAAAERDLAAMRAYLNEIQHRWARIQDGYRALVDSKSPVKEAANG